MVCGLMGEGEERREWEGEEVAPMAELVRGLEGVSEQGGVRWVGLLVGGGGGVQCRGGDGGSRPA